MVVKPKGQLTVHETSNLLITRYVDIQRGSFQLRTVEVCIASYTIISYIPGLVVVYFKEHHELLYESHNSFSVGQFIYVHL